MSESLVKLRERFEAGELPKLDYYLEAQKRHGALSEHAEFLKGTEIASIRIEPGRVILTTDKGIAFECDPSDRGIPPIVGMNQRAYEREDTEMFFALAENSMTLFDIGANIGWYSLHFARLLAGSRVYSFEPVERTRGFLTRNAEHNDLSNMRVFDHGMYDREDVLTFYVDHGIMGAASAAPTGMEREAPVTCRVRTVDLVRGEVGAKVDFMKIDVEGAELMVLRGAARTLAEDRPIVMAELLRKHAARFGYHPNEVLALLRDAGYLCFTTKGGRLLPFSTMTEETVETNFFFLHADVHAGKIAAHG